MPLEEQPGRIVRRRRGGLPGRAELRPTHVVGHSGAVVAPRARALSCPARCILLSPALFGSAERARAVFSRQPLPIRLAVLHPWVPARLLPLARCPAALLRGCLPAEGTLGWYLRHLETFAAPQFARGVRHCLLSDTEACAGALVRPEDVVLMGRRDRLYARNGPPPGLRCRWAWTDAEHFLETHGDLRRLLEPWWR